jgi:hypothetical protein
MTRSGHTALNPSHPALIFACGKALDCRNRFQCHDSGQANQIAYNAGPTSLAPARSTPEIR